VNPPLIPTLATALLLIAGCAQLNRLPPATGEHHPGAAAFGIFSRDDSAVQAEEVQMLLAYYQRMLSVSAEDLRREFTAVSQVFGRDKAESARLKLALLMSIPGASFRDDARLLTLLEGSTSRALPPESPHRQLVTLLSRLTGERVRQLGAEREGLKKVESELKEAQRRAEEQQQRADALQKRADELQQKLDKLLAIDREMRHSPRRIPR
jgi:hypothetical protein